MLGFVHVCIGCEMKRKKKKKNLTLVLLSNSKVLIML